MASKTVTPKYKTYEYQDRLPRLPVPDLESTLAKYLENARLFCTEEEFKKTLQIVTDFKSSGEAVALHQLLLERAKEKSTNSSWLIDWWNHWAYLDVRDSIVINVSYSFNLVRPLLPVSQARRAAILISGLLDFKRELDKHVFHPLREKNSDTYDCAPTNHSQEIPPELGADGKPLCMHMYQSLFNTVRIPCRSPSDMMRSYHRDPLGARTILVCRNNRFFLLDVFKEVPSGNSTTVQPLSVDELEAQLERIKAIAGDDEAAHNIGPLTSEHRDVWAEVREELLRYPGNRTTLSALEATLFAVCLDSGYGRYRGNGDRDDVEWERALWHGDGGRNRFFDKSFQLIVHESGLAAGINGEHTDVDGSPACRMTNYAAEREHAFLKSCQDFSHFDRYATPATVWRHLPAPLELTFQLSAAVVGAIERAEQRLREHAAATPLATLYFTKYGKAAIKRWRLSPDAVAQMAMQLAVHRCYGNARHVPFATVATYESGSTRKFLRGRTETVRTVSAESQQWVRAMQNPSVGPAERLRLLRAACERHVATFTAATDAQGIDRHLLGLRLIARENGRPEPALFRDPTWARCSSWRLSTSQLTSPYFEVVFGPVVDDGLGCCYGIQDHRLHFKATSAANCPTDATTFLREVEKALLEIEQLGELAKLEDQKKQTAKL